LEIGIAARIARAKITGSFASLSRALNLRSYHVVDAIGEHSTVIAIRTASSTTNHQIVWTFAVATVCTRRRTPGREFGIIGPLSEEPCHKIEDAKRDSKAFVEINLFRLSAGVTEGEAFLER